MGNTENQSIFRLRTSVNVGLGLSSSDLGCHLESKGCREEVRVLNLTGDGETCCVSMTREGMAPSGGGCSPSCVVADVTGGDRRKGLGWNDKSKRGDGGTSAEEAEAGTAHSNYGLR